MIDVMENEIISTREQIQEDILAFASSIDDEKIFFTDEVLDEICEIIVSNFNKFLDK
jgi:hypothetical protein